MNILYYPDITHIATSATATTGFFDGVHKGHTAVLHRLKEIAKQHNIPSCVITYWPHPRITLGKDNGLKLLSTFEEKTRLIEKQGIDYLVVIPFTADFSQVSTADFLSEYLQKMLHVKYLVVGYDHRIGKGATGGFEQIKLLGGELGIEVEMVEANKLQDVNISSTKIRNAIHLGNILQANEMLGYAYEISGKVTTGKKIGNAMGYPTANIVIEEDYKLVPKSGVYVAKVVVSDKEYGGMLSIGNNPTIDPNSTIQHVETHIFKFSRNIYGENILIRFVERIRDNKRFNSLEELKGALDNDKIISQKILCP
ncbi:MAG: bifunctional riboflavin kinase/FAD synthetase [Prevotellaceae bacterium]|jgi:riboflavin kinase/FMN adenylyltransferase|nr:bifunctional riboflavin kinase/FAD synthetase [Prevotellaceae bacterium]